MSKKKRAIGVGRMTPATIAAVIAEIEAYERGERTSPLTWKALHEFSGFSHVSLWKKGAIKSAFVRVQHAQRADATPRIKIPKTSDERILTLQNTITKFQGTIRAYDELWALYEHNIHRLGLEPDELRRPLDPVARDTMRSRRVRIVR